MRRPAHLALPLALAACGGATADPGLDLQMRVPGAQLVRAPLPAAQSGPNVTLIEVPIARVQAGSARNRFGGRTALGAFAVNIAVDREASSYWIVPTGVADPATGELTWQAVLELAKTLDPGAMKLQVQAVDEGGRTGPVAESPLEVVSLFPTGELVVTLEWSADVDADLWVTDPTGATLSPKNINTWAAPPPGNGQPDPDAWKSGGMLDIDSNANCVIDGVRRENAVWAKAPTPGHYTVRVALARPCGVPSAGWQVTVRRRAQVIATAGGELYSSDAYSYPQQPPQADGVLALEFDVP